MVAKSIIVICTQALLVQIAFGCPGNIGLTTPIGLAGRGLGYDGILSRGLGYDGIVGRGVGCGGIGITATSGGGLPVASASAIPPVGVSVSSQNIYEGILAAFGELPFVGTVGVEGVLPTAGAGAVNYDCGNGATAMVSDIGIAGPYGIAGVAGPYGVAGIAGRYAGGLGYRNSAGRGCGCGL